LASPAAASAIRKYGLEPVTSGGVVMCYSIQPDDLSVLAGLIRFFAPFALSQPFRAYCACRPGPSR
jgi:hypothetical protein